MTSWLTARPIAHRGLHGAPTGLIENTRSSCAAALEAGFGIEVDLQLSSDVEAMVFHDHTLDRLTASTGPLLERTASALQKVHFRGTTDAMMTFGELLTLVRGRVPLVVELKSRFDGDLRLAERAAAVAAAYTGPLAFMSFDPLLVAALRRFAPQIPRGITAERHYADHSWDKLSVAEKRRLGHLLHWPQSRFQFVAFRVNDLPTRATQFVRRFLGMPLLTWTVRRPIERVTAQRYADQMIFEGFLPERSDRTGRG